MISMELLLLVVDQTVWYCNVFFYLFIIALILIAIILISLNKKYHQKIGEMKLMQQQHTARVDIIRKEQSDTLEKLRIDMLKKEEERSRQWMESEKETLHVLNGISTLLDLSEKIGRVESEKILEKLAELTEKVNSMQILKALEDLQIKVKKLMES